MANGNTLSGLEDDQLIPASEIIKSYLPEQRKRGDWRDRVNISFFYFMAGLACIILRSGGVPLIHIRVLNCGWLTSFLLFLCLIAFPLLWLLSKPRNTSLPFDMPAQANRPDPGDVDPKGKPQKASGAINLGVEQKTGKQVWLSNKKVSQHLAIPGTTGSGKSSMILGLITNALCHGSGVFEIDAKGSLVFVHQVVALARLFGRDADVRILNLLNSDPYVTESFNSSTFNMLSMAPADDISSLLTSMRSEMGKDNQSFADRGASLVSAVVRACVWLRDNLDIPLSIVDLRDCIMNLDRLMYLMFGCDENGNEYDLKPDFLQHSDAIWVQVVTFMSKPDIIAYAQTILNIDVRSLKHLDPKNKRISPTKFEAERRSEVTKQHGFATMAFTNAFQNMIGNYKRIFGCLNGDVTIDDAVKNRRIVIVLLPSLGKSRSDTLSASKIIVSNIRGMASRALGTKTYGNMKWLLDSQVTNASSGYLIVFEEAGPYVQDGMDQLYQQSRSLNLWIATCFQDLPGLQRNDAAVAQSILGNANYPLFMRLQDPTSTGKWAKDMGEQEYTALVRSFEEKAGLLDTKRSVDTPNMSIERMERVTFRDLQSQKVGQATMIAEGKIVRLNAFYCEPLSCVPTHKMTSRINRFASWRLPFVSEIVLVPLPNETAISLQRSPGRAVPAAVETVSKRNMIPADYAKDKSAIDAMDEHLERSRPKTPLFPPPVPTDPRVPEHGAGAGQTARSVKFDAFDRFYSILASGEAERVDRERQLLEYSRKQLEHQGVINVWDEFVALSFVGLDIAGAPSSPIDLGTMTVGLICLSGIRARFRRDGKLPPYLPKRWTTRNTLPALFETESIMEITGDDEDGTDQLLSSTGPHLTNDDEMPRPRYMEKAVDFEYGSEGLGDENPDGDDETPADSGGVTMPKPLDINDEARGLLDRKD